MTMLGAAGMMTFEPATEVGGGVTRHADALWWTALVIATVGSDFSPVSPDGHMLTLLLAVYGYITARVTTFFIGQEAEAPDGEVAGSAELQALCEESALLRDELRDAKQG